MQLTGLIPVVLLAIPVAGGIFVGAPLLAREFEHGTHRFLWTQEWTRGRWLATTYVLVIVPLGLAYGVVAFLSSLWIGASSNYWSYFDEVGFVLPAYAIFAIALGIFFGALIRRLVAAMGATLVGFFVARVGVTLLRSHFEPATRVDGNALIPDGAWVFPTEYTDTSGRTVSEEQVAQLLNGVGSLPGSVVDFLRTKGVMTWISYQPADRFWTFQAIEAGIFLALAFALLAASAYLVRRDAS
jgi:hypothetical protein